MVRRVGGAGCGKREGGEEEEVYYFCICALFRLAILLHRWFGIPEESSGVAGRRGGAVARCKDIICTQSASSEGGVIH